LPGGGFAIAELVPTEPKHIGALYVLVRQRRKSLK